MIGPLWLSLDVENVEIQDYTTNIQKVINLKGS